MPVSKKITGDSITILHVDDDPDFTDVTKAFLERENDRFTVETAHSADEGIEYLADTAFDCVISDYDMPKQTGIEFLRDTRDTHPDIPFILYTGKGSEEVASEAIAAGATEYLQKESGTDQYTVLANRIETLVERRRAQQRQRQQLDAIETAREGIAILDADGCYVYANEACAEIYRTTPDEIIGKHWTRFYPEDETGYVQTEILPRVEEDGYWRGKTTGRRVDGTTFTQDCALSATEEDKIICTVQDISDQIESAKQLNRYRTLVEAIEDPVYVLNEEGQFEFVNESFVETFGYEFDEVFGSDVSLIKDETALEQGLTNLGRILSSDGPDSIYFETEIQQKSGEVLPCEDHMAVLPYEGETFDGSVGILRDISERKQREQALRRRNKRLDEFASVVSHDLRNPLNVAEGNLELLRETCDSDRIDNIDRALTRMNELIDDLLQLARADDEVSDMEAVDIADLSTDCWQNVETADATIRAQIDRTVQADRSQLAQLLENLFRNAIEHSGQHVTITVGESGDGFYVEDTGPGIPEDEREAVFEAGYTTTQDGTGFGLSIVNQVVEAHGWNIRVTEASAGGARFEITGVEFDAE